MSVLIKDLKMPNDCPVRITLYPNGRAVKANAIDYEEFDSVSVLPHGRLIDADALEDENITYYAVPIGNIRDAEPRLVISLADLDNATTIIEKEI